MPLHVLQTEATSSRLCVFYSITQGSPRRLGQPLGYMRQRLCRKNMQPDITLNPKSAIGRVLRRKVAQTFLSVQRVSQLHGTDRNVCATLFPIGFRVESHT